MLTFFTAGANPDHVMASLIFYAVLLCPFILLVFFLERKKGPQDGNAKDQPRNSANDKK